MSDKPNKPQPKPKQKGSKKLPKGAIVGLAVLLILLTVGASGVWFYQKNIHQLRKQVEELQKQLASKETEKEIVYKVDTDVKLPVVVYEPSYLFDEAEKNGLKEHLVNPFFDYYNAEELSCIALVVVKQENSSEYIVSAINKYGKEFYGILLGKGDYWFPHCMGSCNFSEEFKRKYPEIVKLTPPYQESESSN